MRIDSNVVRFTDEQPDPNFKNLTGYIYLIGGVLLLPIDFTANQHIQLSIFPSILCCMLGYFQISNRRGAIFDFNRNSVKKYWAIAWFKFGKWEKIAQPRMVVLDKKKFKFSTPNEFYSVYFHFHIPHLSERFRVCISYRNAEKFDIILHFKDYEKALQTATFFTQKLNLTLENRALLPANS